MLSVGVDIRKTRAMAAGLGARDFRERPFFPDPYSVLNKSWSMAAEAAAPNLTDEQLQAAHRELQIKFHPDRHASTISCMSRYAAAYIDCPVHFISHAAWQTVI